MNDLVESEFDKWLASERAYRASVHSSPREQWLAVWDAAWFAAKTTPDSWDFKPKCGLRQLLLVTELHWDIAAALQHGEMVDGHVEHQRLVDAIAQACGRQTAQLEYVNRLLLSVAKTCPCGARPDAVPPVPHTGQCLVEMALCRVRAVLYGSEIA